VDNGASYTNNSASQNGGAIFNDGTATVIASFGTNTATAGGAIENYFGASLTIRASSSFTGNIANYGGAIDSQAGTTMLAVTGASFTNNTANVFGGAIDNHTNRATFSGCTFTGNHALGTGGGDGGGAIWNDGSVTVGGSSSFSGNTAALFGGAIANFGTATVTQTAFTSTATTPGNSAGTGGAIANWSGASLSVGAGTNFTGNTATAYGGGIYNNGTLGAGGASFSNNTAPDGGAIINYFDATVSGCTFTSNHSTGTGHNYDGGGAIWNDWSLTVQSNCNFFTNTAAADGGAINNFTFGSPATATVSQSAFDSNSAGSSGGAIMNWSGTSLTVNAGTTFTGNHANFGGAILTGGTLSATGATFASNHADDGGSGGAVFNVDGGSAILTSCGFSGNTAVQAGGALANQIGAMTVSGCQLTFNSAQIGGAIVNLSGVLNVVSGCDISGNTATVSGGGIYTFLAGTTNIQGSFVEGNGPDDTHTVTSDGSVLNVDGSSIVPNKTVS
jgi:predicted outer membrane repeat protein